MYYKKTLTNVILRQCYVKYYNRTWNNKYCHQFHLRQQLLHSSTWCQQRFYWTFTKSDEYTFLNMHMFLSFFNLFFAFSFYSYLMQELVIFPWSVRPICVFVHPRPLFKLFLWSRVPEWNVYFFYMLHGYFS